MSKRTASEIRAYCESVPDPLVEDSITVWAAQAQYAKVGLNARTDVPRLLDVAAKLRKMLAEAYAAAWAHQDPGPWLRERRCPDLLADTAWLELSPEPALSPPGEMSGIHQQMATTIVNYEYWNALDVLKELVSYWGWKNIIKIVRDIGGLSND